MRLMIETVVDRVHFDEICLKFVVDMNLGR